MNEVADKACQGCGTTITPEQIALRQAGLVYGVLLCPACVDKKRKEAQEAQRAAMATASVAPSPAPAFTPPKDISDERISLDEDLEAPPVGPSKIRSFASGSTLGGAHHESSLKRSLLSASDPATRIRTFHSKLTPGALAHMDDLINEWIDSQPDIFIKHVNTTVGPFEAKHVEQHLIVTIFY